MSDAHPLAPLPLPVAALLRRARNAKSPRDRHDTAYRAWEVAIMLAAATRIATNAPPSFERPSIGDWVAVLRREEGPQLRSRAVLALHAFLRKAAFEETAAPQSVSASKLLEAIPRYRNRFVGHGTVLEDQEFYTEGADRLVDGLDAAAEAAVFGPRTARLVVVEMLEIGADGVERRRVTELTGEAPCVLDESASARLPPGLAPSRVYVWDTATTRIAALHPFAAYDPERERVYLFNGVGRRAEFLDFGSGERLAGKTLEERFPGLDGDLLRALRVEHRQATFIEEQPPDGAHRFSDFRILGKLGEGGMGEVYLAVQESLDRVVALKVIRSAQADDAVARGRFQREIRALARCDHPNVVKILSSGSERGVLWYAMEHVEGVDLSQLQQTLLGSPDLDSAVSVAIDAAHADRRALFPEVPAVTKRRLSAAEHQGNRARQLVEVMRDAARGVAHLHERGILHRDLKPANLMLTTERRVVVMDLGLAAMNDASISITRDKAKVLGTLRYMPPEQLERNSETLDERADVYALGATFYELLTERPFFDGDSETRVLAQVLREEPMPARKANPALARDVAAILHHATAKDRAMRYPKMSALAADIDAYLDGRAISAREPTFAYYLSLAVRKNRALAAAVLGLVVVLVAALVVSLGLLDTAESANREKDHALGRVRTIGLVSASQSAERVHPITALLLAREAAQSDATPRVVNQLRAAVLASLERGLLHGHEAAVQSADFSPDGSRIVTASGDKTARVWDISGKEVAVLRGHAERVTSAVISENGTRILTASDDKTARVWDISGNELAVLSGHSEKVTSAVFSKDGNRILTASLDKTARVWEVSGRELAILRGHEAGVNTAWFSADGARVLTASSDKTARVWDVTGKELSVLRGHQEQVSSAVFSPDDTRIVTASNDKTARVWDAGGKELAVLHGHEGGIDSAVFSPDGTRIATAGVDHTARVWDVYGKELAVLRGHEGYVYRASFSPDGTRIVTASHDHTSRVWNLVGKELSVLRGHDHEVRTALFSPDGARIVTASWDRTARVWDVIGTERAVLRGHEGRVWRGAFSPSGAFMATASDDATARVWDASGKEVAVLRGHQNMVWSANFSADSTRIVTASSDKTARVWDLRGTELAELRGHNGIVRGAVFAQDGTRIVTASDDTTARVWDVSGKALAVLRGHSKLVMTAEFSPDGTHIVTASHDTTARVWNVSGKELAVLAAHEAEIQSAVFSPDGARILTASYDETARVWDVSGEKLSVLREHTNNLQGAVFSPNGDRIATASSDQTARVWDVAGKELASLRGHENEVWSAAFSPDGTRIVTTSTDKTARMWDVSGTELAVLRGHQSDVRSAVFAPGGRTILTTSDDGTARLWLVYPEDLLALADTRITRDFTEAELTLYADLLSDETKARARRVLSSEK